ncbi:3-phosphoshikimate 1-carboxyvinyltransferase [Leucobacter denitrificans]|uniref:3-phosphoshikimate 1-carboxyvinyltransferase n=1 Tax=Leucobacter denitrificans TaxID=683042 RepID=A0A7G9S6H1_9MICO|nr:3-phosphoshikimate 1-carboxyvinyltransferase [Leucobacter denitrificans]QNN63446.1 3-phosphoshikimate 1-carboxyvinyltransferase [Leucobacter denitrificans]
MFAAKMNRGKDGEEVRSGDVVGEEVALWAAPTVSAPIQSRVSIPGSKSLTGRELILAALADGPGTLRFPLRSRDTDLMVDALKLLGTSIEPLPGKNPFGPDLRITPAAELTGSTSIECGLAGTVMRFMPAVAALSLGPVAFDGDPYARKRPMRPVLEALRSLGADISDDGRGSLPFTVHGAGSLRGGRVEVDASLSSQFVSALLLAAPRFAEGVHVIHTGERLPSVPHIEMTLEALRARGVEADSPAVGEWRVAPGPIAARDLEIEPDLSNAAPFLAAALATGGSVSIPNWPADTTQVGDTLRTLLPEFGATATLENGVLTVASSGPLRGVNLHIPEAGELSPTFVGLAALAAQTKPDGSPGEPSTITGIGHTRHHETDRIAALVTEINALGGRAEELEDGIAIHPAQLHGGLWHAYADHRIASTGALIGLAVAGVEVDDIATTSKTLPEFPELWLGLAGVEPAPAGDDSGDDSSGVTTSGFVSGGALLDGMGNFIGGS